MYNSLYMLQQEAVICGYYVFILISNQSPYAL